MSKSSRNAKIKASHNATKEYYNLSAIYTTILEIDLETFCYLIFLNLKYLKIGKFSTYFGYRYKYEIFIRDDFTCYLCGARATKCLFLLSRKDNHGTIRLMTNTSWLTVDHLQRKRSKGKENFDNLKTCCYRCNKIRN